MEGCNRAEVDGAVNIRAIERWIADHVPVAHTEVGTPKSARRVAVVGGGPAGLAAAYTLARKGHEVVIFEGEMQLGGVLRTGIPTYRLPRDVVDREIEGVLRLGVEARCGEFLTKDRIAALAREFDAVVIGTGLQKLRGIDGDGGKLRGVEQGIAFLHRVTMDGATPMTGHVVVLGGGNTALDCARSALRCGAAKVTVAYRRTRKEMPAIAEEVEEALHEGIEFRYLSQPVGFVAGHDDGDRVKYVKLAAVELGEPDASGRRSPIVTDKVERLRCDAVLLALGQSADLSILPQGWKIDGVRVLADGRPSNVYAAGDVATGEGTVTHAIGNGRRAATTALADLGEEVTVFERPDRTKAVPVTDIRVDHFAKAEPAREALEQVATRTSHFREVNKGLANALESHRCFSCGHCTRCDTCLVYCPEGVIRRSGADYAVDYTNCKGCGICVTECPRRAMEMV
jgi:NADPH-dependent glutamate synthase beta subunit-like oxidoreductase/Pyruvate/2-oxoacid:ferredoxin oxidoreductase delta subunit